MEILGGLIIALAVLAVPFVVPIVAWVSARRLRNRLDSLEELVSEQRSDIERLSSEVRAFQTRASRATDQAPSAPPIASPPLVAAQPVPELLGEEPTRPEAEPEHLPHVEPERTAEAERPIPTAAAGTPQKLPEPVAVEIRGTESERETPADMTPEIEAPDEEGIGAGVAARSEPPPPSPPPPPVDTAPPSTPFDWESLVGVKLFSAIAGIALVIAAVFFLRYSIESGWLQPPVRVAIGIIVAIALLVACELKAARRYPATANALDAAAIAILFSTFFAAHALWDLIPASVTFGLLAVVTALAVLLSIRRESMFIAVLGLLGGFATPALLSTGENRPIPLFAYLLLLNLGLAWVAYQKRWPVLTWLTLIFTTLYQWGWVMRYLDSSSLPLAMGIFILFPVVSVAALLINRTPIRAPDRGDGDDAFNHAALISAALPVLFGVYLAAVPEYGARPALLFGFVLLIDLGLLAIAIGRHQELLHATGAMGTILTVAIWMTASYGPDARFVVLGFTTAYSLLYLFAPALARWFERPFRVVAATTPVAGPLLLFAFPVLAAIEPAFEFPRSLFLALLALLLVIAARAIYAGKGNLYFIGAFFAVATEAAWSAAHLTLERLATAVAIYATFGVVALAVPIAARRLQRPLMPAWGGGAVLLSSLLLLLFISTGSVAPAALWGLALLLRILNAALFVESAAGRLPLLSQAGSILSWIVLATWWNRAAGSVGVIPSLAVLTGLVLVTLAGHAWSLVAASTSADVETPKFSNGLYLALFGHLFLTFLALNREWAVPPWPLFGALAVMTLAVSSASLVTGVIALHTAGTVAAAIVVAAWSGTTGAAPYGLIALIASLAVAVYAIGWTWIARGDKERLVGLGAVGALLTGEMSALASVGGDPPFVAVLAVHSLNIACMLWLATRYAWRFLPLIALAPAWMAVLQWQWRLPRDASWSELLWMASALYVVFAVYPFVLGRRVSREREPYLAAVIASAMFFVGARAAFLAGGLDGMIGVVPIVAGGVLALLLRQLLSLQPVGERDTGRLALVAGAALAFVTVAIPLQLSHQWITIGWALEGAALAWLYGRIPHRGLLVAAVTLLGTVFVRLALNPEILLYEPRGAMRILNWYLYTYMICSAAMLAAGWWLSKTGDRLASALPRASHLLPAAGVVLLFLLLNIEIADFYATGPAVTFRFGVTVSQDLTYTIGWLAFGMALLAAGIYLSNRPARIAAVSLIAVTTFKCFLYDLGSLEGLYRVASFVGLAVSLALVSLALQKFVLSKPRRAV